MNTVERKTISKDIIKDHLENKFFMRIVGDSKNRGLNLDMSIPEYFGGTISGDGNRNPYQWNMPDGRIAMINCNKNIKNGFIKNVNNGAGREGFGKTIRNEKADVGYTYNLEGKKLILTEYTIEEIKNMIK